MIHLAPFENIDEHLLFCKEADVLFEDGTVGFKIFSDEENLGLCQIKFVGEAAYILNLTAIEDRLSVQMLANVFTSVIEFLRRVEIESIVFPIQSENDVTVCEATGFDRISETLYVFDFVSNDSTNEDAME